MRFPLGPHSRPVRERTPAGRVRRARYPLDRWRDPRWRAHRVRAPLRRPRHDRLPVGSRRRAGLVLAALVAGDAAVGFQQTAILPAIPTIERDLGASPARAALLASAYLVVAAVLHADPRQGRRRARQAADAP